MAWAVHSLDDARRELQGAVIRRISPEILRTVEVVRIPVGFLWLPEYVSTAKNIVKKYAFWHDSSGMYFDIILMGWAQEGDEICFDSTAFNNCLEKMRQQTKCRYSGEVDLLLLHFEYHTTQSTGTFSYADTIPLPVDEMIKENKTLSVNELVQKIINTARDTYDPGQDSPLWEIQNRIAFDRGRRAAWNWVSDTFLKGAGKIYNEMKSYMLCDLRKEMI